MTMHDKPSQQCQLITEGSSQKVLRSMKGLSRKNHSVSQQFFEEAESETVSHRSRSISKKFLEIEKEKVQLQSKIRPEGICFMEMQEEKTIWQLQSEVRS